MRITGRRRHRQEARPKHTARAPWAFGALLAGCGLLLSPKVAHADPGHGALRCKRLTFPVALAPGQPAADTVVGWLCTRGPIEGRTIQVLLHGGTYNHHYWDWPLDPGKYSYVHTITRAGYVTLNLDRLGEGQSSHPDPNILTLHVGAYAVHQIVDSLRAGFAVPGLGVVRDNPIELVGHSLGSFISTIEASTYDDVDGVILSGYSHVAGPGIATLVSTIIPAAFDPKFAGLGLPLTYLTTAPGTRGLDFYYLPNADPAVVALDEQLKDVATLGEELDLSGPTYAASAGVGVPTLIVDGDYDLIDCLAPSCSASHSLDNEASYFPPEAQLQVVVLPDAGHDINLQKNAQDWFAIARRWSDANVGTSSHGNGH